MDTLTESMNDSKSIAKQPVVRGARACTVCRAAKMKCVGAEDGQKQCQRCKRANVECIFEKHRRGRKPGSKLSEASKMLRRLEKGLNSAKLKSQTVDPSLSSTYTSDPRGNGSQDPLYNLRAGDPGYSGTHFPSNELPPLNLANYQGSDNYGSNSVSRSMDVDDEDEDLDRNEEVFPIKLIKRENRRNSFFRTILNPEESPSANSGPPNRGNSYSPPQARSSPAQNGLSDPIAAELITEEDAKVLFDLMFLRLNPFINLFDPALHTVPYVRSKCPFLFTTLIMAGCKFFKPERFKACQKLANEFAVRAFTEQWKRVEVVQAFACLTYWKDPDDNRTWMYIGYACRMAVELGLNRYVANPSVHETDFQKLERRNKERTYLVLFVHDRSLSTQTGRHWMLPEDELIKHSTTWHEGSGGPVRPEDVIIAAFVALRRIAAETTGIFNAHKSSGHGNYSDIDYGLVLNDCNAKLTQWDETWREEMKRAGGEKFHHSFLAFFRLYVRLFLNSFGIQASMSPARGQTTSMHALTACCSSALDSLRIVSQDFASMSMLRYGQDSITVMSAYSAVFLLKLLRNPSTHSQLSESTARDIHLLISQTADAFEEASGAYHARFLRSLIANDTFNNKSRRNERERHDSGMPIDPRLQALASTRESVQHPIQGYSQPVPQAQDQSFHFPASPHLPAHPQPVGHEDEYHSDMPLRNNVGETGPTHYPGGYVSQVPLEEKMAAQYWRNMFLELGFGNGDDPTYLVTGFGTSDLRNIQQYPDIPQTHPSQLPYHQHIHTVGYGH